jgi:ribosomal protein S21
VDQFQDARADRTDRERRTKTPSFEVLLRRFFRDTQQSRILSEVKARRNRREEPSRDIKRKSAVRKEAIRRIKRGW